MPTLTLLHAHLPQLRHSHAELSRFARADDRAAEGLAILRREVDELRLSSKERGQRAVHAGTSLTCIRERMGGALHVANALLCARDELRTALRSVLAQDAAAAIAPKALLAALFASTTALEAQSVAAATNTLPLPPALPVGAAAGATVPGSGDLTFEEEGAARGEVVRLDGAITAHSTASRAACIATSRLGTVFCAMLERSLPPLATVDELVSRFVGEESFAVECVGAVAALRVHAGDLEEELRRVLSERVSGAAARASVEARSAQATRVLVGALSASEEDLRSAPLEQCLRTEVLAHIALKRAYAALGGADSVLWPARFAGGCGSRGSADDGFSGLSDESLQQLLGECSDLASDLASNARVAMRSLTLKKEEGTMW